MGQGTGLEKVQELVLSGRAANIHAERSGKREHVDLLGPWCEYLKRYAPNLRPMKIVMDFGSGVMGPIMHELLRHVDPQKKLDVIPLFDEPDGAFPWHPADPLTLVNLQHLQGAVIATKADFGVAFDGDGDRLAFVDDHGKFVGCDLMTALFAERLLAKPENRGKHVLYDLRSSRAVKEAIEQAGGVPEMCRVGHSHIKAAMRGLREGRVFDPLQTGEIILAGELSGHFFFSDCFSIDTSERALLLALEIMSTDDSPLSRRVRPLQKYWQSGELNFRLPDADAMRRVLESVEERFSNKKIFRLDGISVVSESGQMNVRLSNTEPVVRLTAESYEGRAALDKTVAEVEGLIAKLGGVRKGL